MTKLTEHLKARHLDLDLHRPVLDDENDVATFYLWNLSGQLVGYQQYRPSGSKTNHNDPREGKYFTFRKLPTVAVFGVETLHLTPNLVFVTEGVLMLQDYQRKAYLFWLLSVMILAQTLETFFVSLIVGSSSLPTMIELEESLLNSETK